MPMPPFAPPPFAPRAVRRRGRFAGAALVGVAVLLALPSGAAAQEDRNTTLLQRGRTDLGPTGINLGLVDLAPTLGVSTIYDDNVFLEEDDAQSDFALAVSPRLSATLDTRRGQIRADAYARLLRYRDYPDLDTENFGLRIGGNTEILQGHDLSGTVSAARETLERDDPEDEDVREATTLDRLSAAFDYTYKPGDIGLMLRGAVDDVDYGDQDDRNRIEWRVGTRAMYDISPRFGTFVEPYLIRRNFENDSDRDVSIYGVSTGVSVDISGVLFGEVGVGLFRQIPEGAGEDSFTAVGLSGQLTWNPTERTSVILDLGRRTSPSSVGGSSEVVRTDVGVELQQEVTRFTIALVRASWRRDDYRSTDRSEDTYRVEAGLRFTLTRRVDLAFDYEFATRQSNETGRDYNRNIVSVGLVGKL